MKYRSISIFGNRLDIPQISTGLRLSRAIRLVWECAPKWTAASALLVAIQGILPLVSLYLMKLIIDSVTIASNNPANGSDFLQILSLIVLAAGASLLSSLCRSALAAVGEAQSAHVSDHVQDLLHSKSIEVDLEYYENSQYYDTLHRAQNEAPFRPTRIVNGLLQAGQASISLLSIFILLISFSPAIAFVLVIASIPGALVRIKFANKTYNWMCSRTPKERYAWYLHWLLTASDYAKEIRLFDLGPSLKDQYSNLRQEIRGERLKITFRRSTMDSLAQSIGTIAVFGSLAFITYRAVQGIITLGDLVMYFGAFQQGQSFLNSLLTSLAGLYEDNLFLKSLYEFLDLKPKVKDPATYGDLQNPIRSGIFFEHVDFRYPGSDIMILENINLHIKAGQVVALVGENGSGKTTLIKLLCRLYDPTSGRITLDGTDLRNFRIADLRKQISVIFQDYARYNLTARENILFGCVNRCADMEDIVRASELSGADKVIRCLEHGYDTVLGKWFDEGAELSIGEWQKIALARAFMRDAQIIILDEPTSALDARAEDEVFQKFKQLAEGKTAIIISHRLSTVKIADVIYFIKDGRIAECGSHDELVKKSGQYAQLFEVQARHYR